VRNVTLNYFKTYINQLSHLTLHVTNLSLLPILRLILLFSFLCRLYATYILRIPCYIINNNLLVFKSIPIFSVSYVEQFNRNICMSKSFTRLREALLCNPHNHSCIFLLSGAGTPGTLKCSNLCITSFSKLFKNTQKRWN